MKTSLLLWGALAVFFGVALVSGYEDEDEEEHVLADNKCKCARVTSRFVPSKDNPQEEVLERNIRIIVPLMSRQNISDPTSPIRTTFVYRMSEICKTCEPKEVELSDRIVTVEPSNNCSSPDTCYTYDRNKCYTTTFPFLYGGETMTIQAALTPASCYAD
ncbi:immunoglobulin J chain [Emydura macquarii macquarii]|uniref:immunoglobulin J chain n=1 Tax=Emydura macquarii macquarii TaxID=1129001 RepID=UPI00352A4FFE